MCSSPRVTSYSQEMLKGQSLVTARLGLPGHENSPAWAAWLDRTALLLTGGESRGAHRQWLLQIHRLHLHSPHMFSISCKTWISGFHYLCFVLEYNVFYSLGT